MTETSTENPYETYASMIAPAALGGALGVLFGRGMSRTTSNVVALSLLAASAAIAAPLITDLVHRQSSGERTRQPPSPGRHPQYWPPGGRIERLLRRLAERLAALAAIGTLGCSLHHSFCAFA